MYEIVMEDGKCGVTVNRLKYYLDAIIDCNKYNSCMRGIFIIREVKDNGSIIEMPENKWRSV